MIRTIVTPIDGSMHAQMALELSINLAAKYDAQLNLLHIGAGDENVPEELYNAALKELKEAENSGRETDIPPNKSQRIRAMQYMPKMLMRKARQEAESKGLNPTETIIDFGDAGERILHHANQLSADLIVMGSRGFGKLKDLVLGSVSHKVFNRAPCPCVTVHQKEAEPGPVEIRSILAPTDGSDQADKAVTLASDIAAKYGAKLVLQYVMWRDPSLEKLRASIDMNLLSQSARDELDAAQHPIAEKVSSALFPPVISEAALNEIGEQVLERGRQTAETKAVEELELVLIDGDPARKIVQIAKQKRADLIVMGSRGLGGAEGLLTGSVSYKVNHASPCSCAVVR